MSMEYKKIVTIKLPTEYGMFKLVGYQNHHPDKYHVALVKGVCKNKRGVLVRVHSSCVTGDIFGSLRCDCGAQLEKSMELISNNGCGVILYLFQEGRGVGLINKLKAYKLQEQGLDTVEANLKLGLPVDQRNYYVAAEILKSLGVKSVRLLTNNPDKVMALNKTGVSVLKRVPIEIKPDKYSFRYLITKKAKLGHILDFV